MSVEQVVEIEDSVEPDVKKIRSSEVEATVDNAETVEPVECEDANAPQSNVDPLECEDQECHLPADESVGSSEDSPIIQEMPPLQRQDPVEILVTEVVTETVSITVDQTIEIVQGDDSETPTVIETTVDEPETSVQDNSKPEKAMPHTESPSEAPVRE